MDQRPCKGLGLGGCARELRNGYPDQGRHGSWFDHFLSHVPSDVFNLNERSFSPMGIVLKKINTERKKVPSHLTKGIIKYLMGTYQSPTFLDRLFVPLNKVLREFERLDVRVISFNILSRNWKTDPTQFIPHIRKELLAEQFRVAKVLGENHFSVVSLTETTIVPLRRMGFKTYNKGLYCIIISFPSELRNFLVEEKAIGLYNFEFDRYRLGSMHKIKLKGLAKWIRATWRNQPVHRFRPVQSIYIHGHTDLVGSGEYNLGLGDKRAKEVKKYLKSEIGSASGIDIKVATKSFGEQYPLVETESKNERNRRVYLELNYFDGRVSEKLDDIRNKILNELKKDTKIDGTDLKAEIECIVKKLTDLRYNDQFFMYTNPGDQFNEYKLTYLRTILIRDLLEGESSKDIYGKLKFLIDTMKFEARKVARLHAKYAIGGGSSINRNDALRMDFINDRICRKDPPSLIGCLKGFETEGAFYIPKPC